jgi:hypothetical protein
MYKTHKKHTFPLSIKSKEGTVFRKECNELLVIGYLIVSVTVPLQILVSAI